MWQLEINDPSGERRTIDLSTVKKESLSIGRSEKADIQLRDLTSSLVAATLRVRAGESKYWIEAEEGQPPVKLGDLLVQHAHLPEGQVAQIGESKLRVRNQLTAVSLPKYPSRTPQWLTQSSAGKDLLWTVYKVARTQLPVYISGETGTGKEIIAQLVHGWSSRAGAAFVPLNCGALPIQLAESELFGHVKGAFTGAERHRAGALLQAHGGTLFLDEIGDLSLEAQVKLLRFLESGEIRAVGSDHLARADIRIVCATHKPLEQLVEEGKFRRDLYYRLASVKVSIPSLRERPEDVAYLAQEFASQFEKRLSPRAVLRLQSYFWPGNVRELRHAIERAVGISGDHTLIIQEDAFDFLLTDEKIHDSPELVFQKPLLSLKEMERVLLLRALKLSNGNRSQAASILGIARSTLFEKLKKNRIMGPRFESYSRFA